MLEVYIDVRRLVAFATDEPLKQQIDPGRIDRGDLQTIAHRRVRGRAAALTQDAALTRETHEIPNRQKIVLVTQLRDQRQLGLEQTPDLLRNAARIPLAGPLPGQRGEKVARRLVGGTQLVRILVAQLIERKRATLGDVERPP